MFRFTFVGNLVSTLGAPVTTQPLGSILEAKPLRQGKKTRILYRTRVPELLSLIYHIVDTVRTSDRLALPLIDAVYLKSCGGMNEYINNKIGFGV